MFFKDLILNFDDDEVRDRERVFLLVGSLILSVLSFVSAAWRIESLVLLPLLLSVAIFGNWRPQFFTVFLLTVICVLRGTLPVMWLFPLSFSSLVAIPVSIFSFLGIFLRSNLQERFFPLPPSWLVEPFDKDQTEHALKAVGACMVFPLMLCGIATPSDLMHQFASAAFIWLLSNIPITAIGYIKVVPNFEKLLDQEVFSADEEDIIQRFFIGTLSARFAFLVLTALTLVKNFCYTEDWLFGLITLSSTPALIVHLASIVVIGFEDGEILYKYYKCGPRKMPNFTSQLSYALGWRRVVEVVEAKASRNDSSFLDFFSRFRDTVSTKTKKT